MRRTRLMGIVVMAVGLLLWTTAGADGPKLPAGAGEVCGRLFGLLDQGKLKETYELTAPVVKKTDTQVLWYGHMESWRGSMGDVRSRDLDRVETVDKFADLPRGEYLKVVYKTDFSTHPDSEEIVVLAKTGDGQYAVAGYEIHYDRWPEAISIIINGLLIVFFIMTLLAVLTWLIGKAAQAAQKKKAAESEG